MIQSACLNTAIGVLVVGLAACSNHEMSFFVTSVRTGDGGNLGGLAGCGLAPLQRLGSGARLYCFAVD